MGFRLTITRLLLVLQAGSLLLTGSGLLLDIVVLSAGPSGFSISGRAILLATAIVYLLVAFALLWLAVILPYASTWQKVLLALLLAVALLQGVGAVVRSASLVSVLLAVGLPASSLVAVLYNWRAKQPSTSTSGSRMAKLLKWLLAGQLFLDLATGVAAVGMLVLASDLLRLAYNRPEASLIAVPGALALLVGLVAILVTLLTVSSDLVFFLKLRRGRQLGPAFILYESARLVAFVYLLLKSDQALVWLGSLLALPLLIGWLLDYGPRFRDSDGLRASVTVPR